MKSAALALSLGLCGAAAAQAAFPLPLVRSLSGARMVFDEVRDRLVCVTASGDVLEHDGAVWRLVPALAPANAAVAYDEVRGKAYFSFLDLREYDGHAATSIGPSWIVQVLVADSQRGRLVGLRTLPNSSPPVLEIVEHDGAAWAGVATFPGSRGALGGAFDRARGVAVLQTFVPGSSAGFETWEWDGATLTGPFVDGTNRITCAFDPVRGQVIALALPAANDGTHAWNGAAWTPLPNSTPPANFVALATDGPGQRVLGLTNTPAGRLRLSRWDGAQWSPAMAGPMPTVAAPLTFDVARGRAVQFGYDSALAEPRQLAEFDGFSWRLPAPSPSTPATFRGSASAYDAVRGETLLFGGQLPSGVRSSELHAWDGATWRLLTTAGPAARAGAALAFDAGRGVAVLVAGYTAGGAVADHWEWNGASWAQVVAAGPFVAGRVRLGYDPLRATLVLHDDAGATWEYVAAGWTQVATGGPLPAPAWSISTQLSWSGAAQQLVAGLDDGSGLRMWGWDGASWASIALPVGSWVHDPARGVDYVAEASTTRLLSAAAAEAADYGVGCGGSATATTLTAFGRPGFGNADLRLDLRAEAALRPALLGFGLAQGAVPLGNGCQLLLQSPIATNVWFTDARGFWSQPLPLPNAPALRGLVLFAQGAVLDPASPGALAMTQGLRLTIGD